MVGTTSASRVALSLIVTSRNRSFFNSPSRFAVTIRTGVVRVAGSIMSPMYDTVPWKTTENDELRISTASPVWIDCRSFS